MNRKIVTPARKLSIMTLAGTLSIPKGSCPFAKSITGKAAMQSARSANMRHFFREKPIREMPVMAR